MAINNPRPGAAPSGCGDLWTINPKTDLATLLTTSAGYTKTDKAHRQPTGDTGRAVNFFLLHTFWLGWVAEVLASNPQGTSSNFVSDRPVVVVIVVPL